MKLFRAAIWLSVFVGLWLLAIAFTPDVSVKVDKPIQMCWPSSGQGCVAHILITATVRPHPLNRRLVLVLASRTSDDAYGTASVRVLHGEHESSQQVVEWRFVPSDDYSLMAAVYRADGSILVAQTIVRIVGGI